MDESMIEEAVDRVMCYLREQPPYEDGAPEDAMALFVGMVDEIMGEARALHESTGAEMPPRWS